MSEIVTGFLAALTGLPIGAKDPVLIFTGRNAAVGGQTVFVTDPIRVPTVPSTGYWVTELVAAMTTTPETVYDLAVEWRDENFFGPGLGMSRRDILQGLRVPVGGGTITDILAASLGQGWLWVVDNPSTIPPSGKPGDLVLDTSTSHIDRLIP